MPSITAIEDCVAAAQRWRDAKDQAHAFALARADLRRDDRIAEAQASAAARPRPQDKDQPSPAPSPRPSRSAKVDVVA